MVLVRRNIEERWTALDAGKVLSDAGAGQRAEFDAFARQTPGIHPGYTSLSYIDPVLSNHDNRAVVRRSEHGMLSVHGSMQWRRPSYNSLGGFLAGSPFVGPEPQGLCQSLAALLAGSRGAVRVPGVVPNGPMHEAIRSSFTHRGFRVSNYAPETIEMAYVHLQSDTGVRASEAFLGGRSRNFRRSAERAQKTCAAAGIRFEHAPADSDFDQLFSRICDVESRSWKREADAGLFDLGLRSMMYRSCRALDRDGKLRVSFAKHDGRDVSYVLGAVVNGTYIGMQFSFDKEYARYRLGDLGQLETMDRVAAEGVREYSLGKITDATQYKLRWAEELRTSLTVLIS
ncbi:MAG: GNAT family N-acetyltransferase [Myxococcota bacterium]